ncbi:MAG: DegT/DnrJ/EryC1/StrS family aminotransferase [Rhizobiales bacterium]|nr:DegT/DnrJ/EryC1/StrS family aminotransferase [Hyphomicrobiales bacterium]
MKTEFTGLRKQGELLRTGVLERFDAVLQHGKFIMGPEVGELEGRLSEFCGARHVISVANGTDALLIALMCAGVGPGDHVLVPSFTYTATAEVILLLGAYPVFAEVDAETFNLDCADLEARINSHDASKGALKAIIGVDLFGKPADWPRLNDIAQQHGLFLIADAAQSFGAKTAPGAVGTLAPVTTASFFPAKPLGCYGDGGAIFTDDDELAHKIRSIRVHGQGAQKYETVQVGMNSRLDTMQAAVLLAKLDLFENELAQRNALAEAYNRELAQLVATPRIDAGERSSWAQYTIKVDNRDEFNRALNDQGVPTAIYYPLPMHLQPAYQAFGSGPGSLPVSEQLCERVISLPMNQYWTDADLTTVCTAVKQAVQSASDLKMAS